MNLIGIWNSAPKEFWVLPVVEIQDGVPVVIHNGKMTQALNLHLLYPGQSPLDIVEDGDTVHFANTSLVGDNAGQTIVRSRRQQAIAVLQQTIQDALEARLGQ